MFDSIADRNADHPGSMTETGSELSRWSTLEAPSDSNITVANITITSTSESQGNSTVSGGRKLQKKRPNLTIKTNLTAESGSVDHASSDSSSANGSDMPFLSTNDSNATGKLPTKTFSNLKHRLALASILSERLGSLHRCRRADKDDDRWVSVEVTQVVTQRLV